MAGLCLTSKAEDAAHIVDEIRRLSSSIILGEVYSTSVGGSDQLVTSRIAISSPSQKAIAHDCCHSLLTHSCTSLSESARRSSNAPC